jgi:hypothetical protein
MNEEFNRLNEEEQLKAENEFLKMKLMLENGAKFEMSGENELPAEIENEFLSNIAAFEKQFTEHKIIKVFDKIGRPQHFKPVADIPDHEMDKAWGELCSYLNEYNINLSVCSPNISIKELYRFATEELFEHETDDMNLPGWTTNFIYDEFHPDPVYDNSRMVEQDLFYDIFRKEDLFCKIHYARERFVFNGQNYDDFKVFSEKINRFKSLFEEIELLDCSITHCKVGGTKCEVKGNYRALAKTIEGEIFYEGDFEIELIQNGFEYWYFKRIQINGFNPG